MTKVQSLTVAQGLHGRQPPRADAAETAPAAESSAAPRGKPARAAGRAAGPVKVRPAGSLKAAVVELLAAVGTLERAAEIAGKGRSQVHRYGDAQEAVLPPVDLVRIWELAAGEPIVTRFLAAESGFVLVPTAGPGPTFGLHAGAGQLSGCHGDFFLHLMEALADQVVEPGEAGRLVADLDSWIAAAGRLRERLRDLRDGCAPGGPRRGQA